MSTADAGRQRIGWKYSTPLQADYLNTFIAGFSTPGLLTRPLMQPKTTGYGADVVIEPFSLLIAPEDKISTSLIDENGEVIIQKLVKVTTTTSMKITITDQTVALGFKYSFENPDQGAQSQWYGEVVALSADSFDETQPDKYFRGIVIATCQSYKDLDDKKYYSIKSNGADISDFLLLKEGWNPQKWLSVISPRRVRDGVYYNKLEVRTHNDSYKGYINGNSGLNIHTNLTYELNERVDPNINPKGTRGIMPKFYNAFRLQSGGFGIAEKSDTLPIEKTSGGIFALVDATITNLWEYSRSFTNNLTIKPVEAEDINIYYDNNTLYIK